jgi:DNA-binding Lrp family transcriptional regulator
MTDGLDALDLRLLDELQNDARITNSQLAARLGVAPSTALIRMRNLVDSGVVTGFSASIDQSTIGRPLQAIVGVTLRAGSRQDSIARFSDDIRSLPDVVQVFFLGGLDDFMIHIAVEDTSALRQFVVEHLSGHATVASTRTSIIFDYHRNRVVSGFR